MKCRVYITETYSKYVDIDAEDEIDAEIKVENMWNVGDITFDYNGNGDFCDADFNTIKLED